MKRFLLLITLSAALSLSAQVPAEVTSRLNHVYDSLCMKYKLKGASAAVDMPGMGVWKRAWGVSAEGVPMNEDMLISLGSNTKTYTSVVILKLHQMGLLSIEDTIGKWITNVQNVNGSITIRQMLNHTSGIASYTDNDSFWNAVNGSLNKKWQPAEVYPYIKAPLFAPGASWSYSNSNYFLAGVIITKVLNTSLAAAYHTHIFAPLGLTRTVLATEETTSLEYAHRWSASIGFPYMVDWDDAGLSYDAMNSVSWAAGGLYATADDNTRFFDGLFNRRLLLADSMLAKMKTTRSIGGGAGYGLGIFSLSNFNGRTVWSHGGSNVGANNENIYDPVSHCTISLLTNQDSIDNDDLLAGILLPLHRELRLLNTGMDRAPASPVACKIYPNPAKDRFTVQNSFEGSAAFVLTDLSGKTVLEKNVPAGETQVNADLAPGIYVYSLRAGLQNVSGKLVVTH